ncbi:autoimmune regulator, partial [Trifolium medium]|nr:autoimmune regulator [Trifolium medium]
DGGFSLKFGPKTLMICAQCEKEYHVSCLRRHSIENLEELPRGNWFCSPSCSEIHSAMMHLVAFGDNNVPGRKDIKWRVLNNKLTLGNDKPLLAKAHVIFGERFRPMFVSEGVDVIKGMIYG